MIDLIVTGVFNAVVDAALDRLGLLDDTDTEAVKVDMQPVVDALTQLSNQTNEVIEVLRKPAETAGAELSQHAATVPSRTAGMKTRSWTLRPVLPPTVIGLHRI